MCSDENLQITRSAIVCMALPMMLEEPKGGYAVGCEAVI